MKSTSLVVLSVFEDQELRDPTVSGGGVCVGGGVVCGAEKLFILLLENRIWAPKRGQPKSEAWVLSSAARS